MPERDYNPDHAADRSIEYERTSGESDSARDLASRLRAAGAP